MIILLFTLIQFRVLGKVVRGLRSADARRPAIRGWHRRRSSALVASRPRFGTIAKHVVLIVVAVIVAYPFYFMVTSSLKDTLEAIRTPPTIFPNELHPENYTDAWSRAPWGRYFINTIFVSVS